jgi:PAS domain S-box-containing protein
MYREKFLMAAAPWETRLLQALADAVIAVDLELRVTYWSPAAEQLYGWAASEASGHRLGLLLTKNLFFHERTFAPLRSLQAGEVWRGDMQLRHKSGRDVDAHVTASTICEDELIPETRVSPLPPASDGAGKPAEPPASAFPRRMIGYVLLHRATNTPTSGTTKQPAKATIAQSGMLFHNSNDIVVILDSSGRVVAWNPAAERVSKWRASEALNHPLEEFIQPVNDLNSIRSALTQHGAWRGEMTIYDRLGEELLLDSDITAVRDHGGNLLGIVTISRDITHTRRSETARRRSEARLRALLSVLPDTFVRVDHKGNIQDFVANGPFHALLDGQTATGRNLRELLPDLAPRLLQAIEQATSEKRIVHLTYHIDNPRDADSSGSLSDATDLIFRVVSAAEEALVIIQDVTELYTIERQLRETEERFRHLVEQKQVGVYVIQEGRFVYVNPRFAELLGREREELLDMPSCLEIILHEDRELAWHNLQRRLAGESLQPYALRLQRRDGVVIEAEIYASLTTYHTQAAVLGTVVDITQRRQAERALRDREELYRTVVASLQEGILIFDGEAQLITGNESAQRLLGVTVEHLQELRRTPR